MRAVILGTARLMLALLAAPAALAAPASQPPAQVPPAPVAPALAEPAPAPDPTPAAAPPAEQPCGTRAARYEGGKGFTMVVTRAGQVKTTNPLRPLTPEVNEVLQVVIAGKVATAYGPDFTSLRRGTAPATIEAMLGGPIRWEPSLPTLADPIAIVTEEGSTLAQLTFRACQDAPAVKAAPKPQAKKKAPVKRAAPKAAEKAPPGFSMPQGAIAE
ncbi:hypothetical protein AO398_06885 [Methylobacterium sp. GXS13]|uniref:hypothetical protein n=1 Tax=Methylobacterium sp. GXS13 TaxID=1730094 RepID=UPI00071BBE2E|nr:hypothetical protein [Methylobacterium sp. GXS13]KST57799.1 hypothetical protein AO398_06885 [Methylobacterium sp. GXS13]